MLISANNFKFLDLPRGRSYKLTLCLFVSYLIHSSVTSFSQDWLISFF